MNQLHHVVVVTAELAERVQLDARPATREAHQQEVSRRTPPRVPAHPTGRVVRAGFLAVRPRLVHHDDTLHHAERVVAGGGHGADEGDQRRHATRDAMVLGL